MTKYCVTIEIESKKLDSLNDQENKDLISCQSGSAELKKDNNNLEQGNRTLCTSVSSGEGKHQKLRFKSVINSHLEVTHVLKSFIYSLRIRRFGIHFQTLYRGVRDIQNGSAR